MPYTRFVSAIKSVLNFLRPNRSSLIPANESNSPIDSQASVYIQYPTLTGFLGRGDLAAAFIEMIQDESTTFPLLAYLIIDGDHFSSINATYGQDTGDIIIKGLASRLGIALVDFPDARCFHLGADEFVVLTRATDAEHVHTQATLLHQRCSVPADANKLEGVSISIGGAYLTLRCGEDLRQVAARAMAALRRAKRTGHPGVVLYSALYDADTLAGVDACIARAVFGTLAATPPLLLMYQPIVSCTDGLTPYFEVLSRIQTETGTVLQPALFLPVIGFRRLDAEFDLALIRAVREALSGDLASLLPTGSGLALNLSVPGLHSRDVVESLHVLRQQFPNVPLIVEITEAAFIHEREAAHATLQQLRAANVRVALDDFGSGFSNISYLLTLPLDILKFDKTLVYGLESPAKGILSALVRAARDCGLGVVAEGVETEQQADAAVAAGFTHIQGFYFGRPAQIPVAGHNPAAGG